MSEEAAPRPARSKRRRKPIDWTLVFMLVGTFGFLAIFGAITAMAPRRPILFVRSLGGAGGPPPKPTINLTASGTATPAAPAGTKGAATAPTGSPPAPSNPPAVPPK